MSRADPLVSRERQMPANFRSLLSDLSRRLGLRTAPSFEHGVLAFVAISLLLRLATAAWAPLAFDEALYWRYSKFLDAGYLDHPFMNPLMIRLGTMILGDTTLGVRLFPILGGIVSTCAIWQAAELFFRVPRVGALAALLFNLTLVGSVGTMISTSDQALVMSTSLLLLALAKLLDSGLGHWWLAVGLAFGLGMCSKYTTAFHVVAVYLWLVLVPANRHWFLSLWPWAGALVATAVFYPVIDWNAHHQWASIVYQGKRMHVDVLTLKYLAELVGSQVGLATPSVFALAVLALGFVQGETDRQKSALVLLRASVVPAVLYFAWHSLHQRVQGNWPEVIYPPAVIAAAYGILRADTLSPLAARVHAWAYGLAVPVGAGLALIVYAQCVFGLMPLGKADPTSRILDYGWEDLSAGISSAATRIGATAIIGTEYEVVTSQDFHTHSPLPVIQITQRIRWANEPRPARSDLAGPLLYVCREPCAKVDRLRQRFTHFDFLQALSRKRGGVTIDQYRLYRAADPVRAVLDPEYAELNGVQQLQ
jgi:hypothetical protein